MATRQDELFTADRPFVLSGHQPKKGKNFMRPERKGTLIPRRRLTVEEMYERNLKEEK